MDYQSSENLSEVEARLIVYAMRNKIRFNKVEKSLCSHAHEKDFLHRNHSKLLSKIMMEKNYDVMELFYKFMNTFMKRKRPLYYKKIIPELFKVTDNMHYAEKLLFLASLLIDFHKKGECSKYISAAMLLYLHAYAFINFRISEEVDVVLRTMMDHLRYISKYTSDVWLFKEYIRGFLLRYMYPIQWQDVLYPILSDMCEISYDVPFDLLSLWHGRLETFCKKYTKHAILENFGRYAMLVKYGYEDQFFESALVDYREAIVKADWNGVFGFQVLPAEEIDPTRYIIRRKYIEKYRSFQIFYLYIKSTHYMGADGPTMAERTLRLLWETIPDPYLTKKHFLPYFGGLQADAQIEVRKAWYWYSRNVQININYEPRSLKHLSRCCIRRRFYTCIQPFRKVGFLDIPASLKSYLCLDGLKYVSYMNKI